MNALLADGCEVDDYILPDPEKKLSATGDTGLLPANFIADRYPNKYKRGVIGGIIITRREVIRVTRRENLCIS